MSKFKKIFLAATAILALNVNYDGARASSEHVLDDQKSNNSFAFTLFEQVTKNSKENIVISPLSAYFALSMTINGAANKTFQNMSQVLGIKDKSIKEVNQQNQSLLKSLVESKTTQLEISNALFADINTPFKGSFIDTCKHVYDAEAKNVDIAHKPQQAISLINTWCKTKTHGKIPSIISQLSPLERMILINSVYFKGDWQSPFKHSATHDDQFITLAGQTVPIKMMYQSEHLSYMKGSDFQALSIPYKGKRQYMYIFLPDKGIDFALFQAKFTQKNWDGWRSAFNDNLVNLSMPKFTINYSIELSDSLKAMGMADAFDSKRADFSNMIIPPNKAWISRVLQKTYMGVDEKGTEAAAVTAVVMAGSCAYVPQKPAIEFKVDHPFILALIDKESDQILFLGSIVEPK